MSRDDKPSLSILEVEICWTPPHYLVEPTRGQVRLIPWPSPYDHARGYVCTSGACWTVIHSYTAMQLRHYVLSEALRLIIDYRMDPQAVHRAFWPLKEYRYGMADDASAPNAAGVTA